MLKGYFYRRISENNPLHSELNIRFEINSKEFIFAKPTNFSREGIRFTLPRGKVILVPDEHIMIILNSPEHGDFRIQCEVCYFCNHTQDENSLVSYGVNFLEISDSIWEVIQEFCGGQLPKVDSAPTDATTPAPVPVRPAGAPLSLPSTSSRPVLAVEPPETPATTEALSPDRTLPASFIPFAPLPPLVPTPTSQVYSRPDAPVVPEIPVEPHPKSGAIPLSTAPFAKTSPTENLIETVNPADNEINTKVAATMEPVTQKTVIAKTEAKIPAIPEVKPVITEVAPNIHVVDTTPSSIQVLAASLATSPTPPTQVKAQSLSQEMIDHLIKKLQAESANPPIEPEPVIPVKTDTQKEQTAVDPVNFQSAGKRTPVNSNKPKTALEKNAKFGDISLNAATPVGQLASETIPFDPFNPFKLQLNDDLKTNGVTSAPSSEGNHNKSDLTAAILGESSLSDFITNPSPAGLPNTEAANPDVAVRETNSESLMPPPTNKPRKNVTPIISIEKKKSAIPADEQQPDRLPTSSKKTPSRLPVIPEVSTTPAPPEVPVATPIITSPSGVSLDQKSIDKLVDSLLKEEILKEQQKTPSTPPVSQKASGTAHSDVVVTDTASTSEPQLDTILQVLSTAKSGAHNTLGTTANPSPLKTLTSVEPKRTLDQKAIDQVVQALTQNYSAKKPSSPVTPRATGSFLNSQATANLNKPAEAQDKTNTFSLNLLNATLQLEHGEVLPCVIEQIYVGGLMVLVGKELSLNSPLKLNISGAGVRIIDVLGTCTNCETVASDGSQFSAEIFFKNMSNTHMEQFRTLIAKLEIKR
jgi:hypothetical protein